MAQIIDLTPPVKYELRDFDAPSVVFGAGRGAYLSREQLGAWYGLYGENSRTPFHKCAEGLFGQGGKLADYDLTIKDGINEAKVMAALRALMSSWGPKHEVKIGTVAVALANWCDYRAPKSAA